MRLAAAGRSILQELPDEGPPRRGSRPSRGHAGAGSADPGRPGSVGGAAAPSQASLRFQQVTQHQKVDNGDRRQERQQDTLYATYSNLQQLRQEATRHLPQIVATVTNKLRSSGEITRLGQDIFRSGSLSQVVAEPQNPQIRSQILGEYPDALILRVTSDREVELTELEYSDATDAKLVGSDSLHEHGKDFRIPIDYSKLTKISNLMRTNGGPFRMKFRLEMLFGGRSTSHVVPVLIESAFKSINNTPTSCLKIAGSTTGHVV